jgi:lysozyme
VRGARRLRGLIAVALVLVLTGLGFAVFRYEVLPQYRPALEVGERYGIDVSNHQGEIDWQRVASSGISFAYIKATEGNDFVDKSFAANWAQARTAGVSRGAYHFFTLCSPGAEQAENFLKTMPSDPKALPPAVDLEFSGCAQRPDRATVQRELRDFITTVERKTGLPVVVYAMPAFVKAYPMSSDLEREHWRRKLFRRPAGDDWTIWQASSLAKVGGIDGPVDLDIRAERGGS